MERKKIAIVGAGRVGSTLAVAWKRAGYEIVSVASRTMGSAKRLADLAGAVAYVAEDAAEAVRAAEIVVIATPDREIAETVRRIALYGGFCAGQTVLHVCGSQTAASLASAAAVGAWTGSLHPLQSFSSPEQSLAQLPGTYFAVDGVPEAVETARKLVVALGGAAFAVPPEMRALYHAAACMASNYTVAVVHAATEMMAKMGLERDEALRALAPILQGTLANVLRQGSVDALTGPIMRADTVTVEKHLRAIDTLSTEESTLYRELGDYTRKIAEKGRNITAAQSTELSTVLRKDIHNCG